LSIHVCGGLTDTLFEKLLDLNVSNVSLAFSGQDGESNIHIMTKKAVEKTGKKIGVGCGSVMPLNVDEVDSKETIIQRIRAIADRIGYENIAYIHPDCGLRNTPQPVIDILLGNLNAASKEFGSSQ
jgi:methionine synthase II (cobalamin-independent)